MPPGTTSRHLNSRIPCELCARLAGGLWFQSRLDPKKPEYAACSMACLDRIAALTKDTNGVMHDKTEMEKAAIKAARRQFHDALDRLYLLSVFNSCTAAEIDGIIEAVWDGVRASMQQQSARGEIPF